MEPTPELFSQLFTQLRSPFGVNILEVSQQLEYLYTIPQSITPLVCFLEGTLEPVLRQHALLGILSWLNNVKSNIPLDALLFIKQHILHVLQKEQVYLVRKTIVRLILTILEDFGNRNLNSRRFINSSDDCLHYDIDWSDLHAIILQQQIQLDSTFPLLTHLIYHLTREQVVNDIPFFHSILNLGFSSESFEVVASAVTFLLSLVGNLRSDFFFAGYNYNEIILQLLLKVAPLGDSQKFLKLAKSLVLGFENGVSLIPFYPLLTNFLPIIRCDQLDIEYRLQLHTFLASAFIFYRDIELPDSDVNFLFDTEIYLCFQIFQIEDADPTMNWLFDIDLMLHELYYRILSRALSLTEIKVKELFSTDSDTSHAIALLLLDNSIDCATEQFQKTISDQFFLILNSLMKTGTETQKMAVRLLDNHANFFSNEIDKNLLETIDVVHKYMMQVDTNDGSRLLLSVIEQATTTDLVFEPLSKLCHEMIQSPDTQIQYYAIQIICHLIEQSSEIGPDDFNKILMKSLEMVSFESPMSSIFNVLSELCNIDSEQFTKIIPQLMPVIMQTLQNDDPYPVSDVVAFLNTVFEEIPIMITFADQIFPCLLNIAQKMWQFETFSGSAVALEVMARIVLKNPTQQAAEETIKMMFAFTENGLCIAAFKVMEIMSMLLPPHVTQSMIETCLKFIDISDNTQIVINAIDALNSLPNLFGNEEKFIKLMLKTVNITINPQTKALHFDESINLAIAETLPEVVVRSNILLEETICFLIEKMKNGGNLTTFSLNALSGFFDSSPDMIPNEIQSMILNFIISLIPEGDSKIVEAASNLISISCTLPIFSQRALEIVNIMAERISKEQPSSLTDNLVAAITVISGQVLGDNFPFETVLPIILRVLPAVHAPQLADDIYPFIANISRIANQQTMLEILRIFINVLARPYQSVMAMQMTQKSIMAITTTLKQCIPNEEAKNQILAMFLGNDQTKIEFFYNSFQRICE
ncbi:hypothetical protein TRFO_08988 [Tritrichomonas foetus]|uniref:Importin N-terminal domain-containing protein n=1 Tax=Tritrichomonas foetus TaxID=1144522 RepID=A0A1J4JLJ9_9EUKA|nr:hypothetical protein TRFO_08988 [Tritrichomonas foetus]|eukprot:OHS98148.1 hypothetical protein TRFO_08988 [Tritrichomonas foetus]